MGPAGVLEFRQQQVELGFFLLRRAPGLFSSSIAIALFRFQGGNFLLRIGIHFANGKNTFQLLEGAEVQLDIFSVEYLDFICVRVLAGMPCQSRFFPYRLCNGRLASSVVAEEKVDQCRLNNDASHGSARYFDFIDAVFQFVQYTLPP